MHEQSERVCPCCGRHFDETGYTPERVYSGRAKSGYLIIADGEVPLHKCDSLSADDERMLLADAGEAFYGESSPHFGDSPSDH